MHFAGKRGYQNKMAAQSAILNRVTTKLGKSTGNTWSKISVNFEGHPLKNVFFTIFFIFFRKQNGRQIRHLESDLDEKQ